MLVDAEGSPQISRKFVEVRESIETVGGSGRHHANRDDGNGATRSSKDPATAREGGAERCEHRAIPGGSARRRLARGDAAVGVAGNAWRVARGVLVHSRDRAGGS